MKSDLDPLPGQHDHCQSIDDDSQCCNDQANDSVRVELEPEINDFLFSEFSMLFVVPDLWWGIE